MSDIDDALISAAGYYTAGVEDPDEAERHPHAAQPGNMPSVAQLVEERDMLRWWLRELTEFVNASADCECNHCGASVYAGDGASEWLSDAHGLHSEDCPWRQAAEYIDGLEGKS